MKGTKEDRQMKPTAAAMELLESTLGNGSGVQTSRGTKRLWGHLEKAGYVTLMKGGGFLGHPFFYDITPEGRKALEARKVTKD